MPYLRFSRDKRGYENTYVFDDTSTDGKSRPRMLYWFRTPPNVKVGRFSLDEDAIRAIEESNPDVPFDWNKMLKIQPASIPKPKGTAQPRGNPDRGRRTIPPARASGGDASTTVRPTDTERSGPDVVPSVDTPGAGPADADELAARAHLESINETETVGEELPEHPVVTLMGDETLARLRAHYAEIRARLTQAQLPPAQLDALETKIERLNPDAWVGLERAVAGIERFERQAESIKAELKHPPSGRGETDGAE